MSVWLIWLSTQFQAMKARDFLMKILRTLTLKTLDLTASMTLYSLIEPRSNTVITRISKKQDLKKPKTARRLSRLSTSRQKYTLSYLITTMNTLAMSCLEHRNPPTRCLCLNKTSRIKASKATILLVIAYFSSKIYLPVRILTSILEKLKIAKVWNKIRAPWRLL